MINATIVLRKDKLNKSNKAPLYYRLIKDGKVNYISAGIAILVHFWDERNKQLKKGYENYSRLNALLTKRLSEVQSVALDLERNYRKRFHQKK